MAALSDSEKARCRYHLGYLGVQLAGSLSFGLPRPIQTIFVVETAMNNVMDAHLGQVRQLLAYLDETETNMMRAQQRFQASSIGEIKLRDNELDLLRDAYREWQGRLADVLGVPVYPYSVRGRGGAAGSIPVV